MPVSEGAVQRWWIVNTDAAHGAADAPEKWLSRGIAVVSSQEKLSVFKTLAPGDMVFMWVSALRRGGNGLSAIGRVLGDVFEVTDPAEMASPMEAIEFQRRVEWLADLRQAPVQQGALRALGINLGVLSFGMNEAPHSNALVDFVVQRLSALTPSPAQCDRRAAAIRALNATRPSGAPTAKPPGQRSPAARTTTTTVYPRCPNVRAWTLDRAAGHCECCGSPAPFLDADDQPFLESHHIVWLSRGGDDVTENTVALCPNCHRELHHGPRREALQALLLAAIPPKDRALDALRASGARGAGFSKRP